MRKLTLDKNDIWVDGMPVDDYAKEIVGNWQHFDSFYWSNENSYEHPEDWCHYSIGNRDSDTLQESNMEAIKELLSDYIDNETIVVESHSHWAVGWVEMLIVKVYERVPNPNYVDEGLETHHYHGYDGNDGPTILGEVTEAFIAFCAVLERLADYPVLDEDDWYQRQEAEGVSNVKDALWSLTREFGDCVEEDNLPEDWEYEVYSYLQQDGHREPDDYPSEDDMFEAFLALDYIKPEWMNHEQRMAYEVKKLTMALLANPDQVQHSFIEGMTTEDLAKAILKDETWEQVTK